MGKKEKAIRFEDFKGLNPSVQLIHHPSTQLLASGSHE